MQGNRAEGVKIESVKRADFDVQLFFKLTDDSITSILFVSNVFHFREKVRTIYYMFLTLSQYYTKLLVIKPAVGRRYKQNI